MRAGHFPHPPWPTSRRPRQPPAPAGPEFAVAAAGVALLLAGALGAASEIGSAIEVSLAALLLVLAYDQTERARRTVLLVGRIGARALVRLSIAVTTVYALVAVVDFAATGSRDTGAIAITATALAVAGLALVGVRARARTRGHHGNHHLRKRA